MSAIDKLVEDLGEMGRLAQELADLTKDGGWKPIETAPKDGTDFLAFCTYGRKHHQMVGCIARDGRFRSWPGRAAYNPDYWMPLPLAPLTNQQRVEP
jgi:hypothetical protein